MVESSGINIIHTLQKKWTAKKMLAHLTSAVAGTILISVLAIKFFNAGWYIVPLIFVLIALLNYFLFYRKIHDRDVTRFVDKTLPEVEESASLVLQPYDGLNFFEKLQVQRIEHVLTHEVPPPKNIARSLRHSIILLLAAIVASAALYVSPIALTSGNKPNSQTEKISSNKPETRLPQIDVALIRIAPPGYTGKATREQNRFNILAEENSTITWKISTSTVAKDVHLIFNDKSVLKLQTESSSGTKWFTSKHVKTPGFYQVKIGSTLSELYRIEMIKDQPPVIVVHAPKPTTLIEPGKQPLTLVDLTLSDDYGIRNTSIHATIASGSGEAVKFKEQQLSFSNFTSGRKQYQLQKQINLAQLGMKAGDELYFYISATDNNNQEKRSDIFIVRIEDTAQLMNLEGMASGIDIKPEFFRSQRQIIIETEQLLRSKDTISVEVFKNRSNELGVDQKLLRLRYGKFLGEETDAEIGGHDHDAEGHNESEDFGNAQKIIDQYSHKHDIAEDATFFDAQTKKQLKATLTEMWKAELQLRTIKPKDALPFEYKALKLLKDLQQQTRVFVAKTGIKTTPLNLEKRLSGDLTKITQPVSQQTFQLKTDNAILIRKALGVLEQVRSREPLSLTSKEILEQASMHLSNKAAAEPSRYLSSLEALRRILRNSFNTKDISIAGSGLQRMITSANNSPQQSTTNPDMKLSHRYFRNLNRRND